MGMLSKPTRVHAPEDQTPWVGERWEYASASGIAHEGKMVERLNELGQSGWEAFATGLSGGAGMLTVFFKRQAQA